MIARRSAWTKGFTLVELLTVIAIIVVLMGLTIPAITSLSKSNELSSAGGLTASLLSVARSEAINQRTLVQLRVVTNWSGDTSASYRKMSLWKLDPDTRVYSQFSKWETFPDGVIFESKDPKASGYSFPDDPGTYFLSTGLNDPGDPSGKATVKGANVTFAWITFTPTGAATYSGAVTSGPEVYFLLVQSNLPAGTPRPNWVQVRVTNLTGRIRVVRPG